MQSEALAAREYEIFANLHAHGTSTTNKDVGSGLFGNSFNAHSSDVPRPPILDGIVFNIYVLPILATCVNLDRLVIIGNVDIVEDLLAFGD